MKTISIFSDERHTVFEFLKKTVLLSASCQFAARELLRRCLEGQKEDLRLAETMTALHAIVAASSREMLEDTQSK